MKRRRYSDLELAAYRRVRERLQREGGYPVSQEDEERLFRAEPLRPVKCCTYTRSPTE